MIPAPVNLPTIWRGADWSPVVVKWKDGNGNPIDLSNWLPVAWTSEFNLNAIITDALNGVTQISMTHAQTTPLKLGVVPWNWFFQNTSTGVVVQPILAGNVEVKNPIFPV